MSEQELKPIGYTTGWHFCTTSDDPKIVTGEYRLRVIGHVEIDGKMVEQYEIDRRFIPRAGDAWMSEVISDKGPCAGMTREERFAEYEKHGVTLPRFYVYDSEFSVGNLPPTMFYPTLKGKQLDTKSARISEAKEAVCEAAKKLRESYSLKVEFSLKRDELLNRRAQDLSDFHEAVEVLIKAEGE